MAALNSIQRAQIAPPNYAPLKPHELEGRVRNAYARIQFTGALIADVITWFRIPVGARIVGGWMKTTATLGAGVTMTLQDNGAVPLIYIPATGFSAAVIVLIGSAATHVGLGGEMQGDTTGVGLMQSVIAGGNPTNGTILETQVMYVVD